jgi:DNA mismatch endonuclease (patch repair protein)
MQGNRNRDTSPEIAVRSLVHRAGLRYRVAARPLPGLRRTADLVFRPVKVSVFIDGCYWHMCPEHGHYPASNASYWTPKLDGNVRRDRETDKQLQEAGWLVMRFWEHQPSDAIANAVIAAVSERREPGLLRQNPGRS